MLSKSAANKRWRGKMSAETVHGHRRRSRTIFQQAVDDDLLIANPFAKIVGTPPHVDKNWNYVSLEMLGCLLDACPTRSWQLLLALCRLAGLRRAEALGLRWADIQWERNRLIVIGKGDRRREVKLELRLAKILLAAHKQAPEGAEFVIPKGSISVPNLWRDFQVICKRAGLKPYSKCCHTLRKNCQTDWAQDYPEYVVCAWMGNSSEVARKHYLAIPESLYNEAAGSETKQRLPEKLPEIG